MYLSGVAMGSTSDHPIVVPVRSRAEAVFRPFTTLSPGPIGSKLVGVEGHPLVWPPVVVLKARSHAISSSAQTTTWTPASATDATTGGRRTREDDIELLARFVRA